MPKAAPTSSDVDFDALGQFELGASGIAAAVLRGAALASQRAHGIENAAHKQIAGERGVLPEASITQKDFEDAARAQVRLLHLPSIQLFILRCDLSLRTGPCHRQRVFQNLQFCLHLKHSNWILRLR